MISKQIIKSFRAFTLAEALITLIIIGLIASLTIPAVISSTEQHEYKTALKKALSSINQVIELNIALDGYGPIETVNDQESEDSLFSMFKNRMNVISTSTSYTLGGKSNYAFFTADGMRYEFPHYAEPTTLSGGVGTFVSHGCATYDKAVQDETGKEHNIPCLVIVDVNGERKPNPNPDRKSEEGYKIPDVLSKSRILDVFPIVVTDKNAYPFGIVAQRAVFQRD